MSHQIESFGIVTGVRQPSRNAVARRPGRPVPPAAPASGRRATHTAPDLRVEATSSALIAAAPLLALLGDIRRKVAADREWGLETPEERLFAQLASRLAAAIDEARRSDVWLTVPELHEATQRPVATLTRWCRTYGDGTWARKSEGDWTVHYPSFETWLSAQANAGRAAA